MLNDYTLDLMWEYWAHGITNYGKDFDEEEGYMATGYHWIWWQLRD